MIENPTSGNINLRGLRNFSAFCETANLELQRFQQLPPFRASDLAHAGQSFRVNVLFLRMLVEDLRDQFLGATTIESKARELSFVDLQHAIRHWLIGLVFANDWTTFCDDNRQPESQSAASHIAKMRNAMQYFTKELETNSGRKALFSSFCPSLQLAMINSDQVEIDALPEPEVLYSLAVKIEKRSQSVQRIKQEYGLDKSHSGHIRADCTVPARSLPREPLATDRNRPG